MKILETSVTQTGEGLWRIVTLVAHELPATAGASKSAEDLELSRGGLGEGPTGHAVPDRIVRYLIEHARGPKGENMTRMRGAIGGNPGTVNRQAWTLATNAPDLQKRLRGWVQTVDRGQYALTPIARRRIAEAGPDELQAWHLS